MDRKIRVSAGLAYLGNFVPGPVGMLSATLGNGLAETRTYNNRTWLNSLTVGSGGAVYSLNPINYSGNGDVASATDSVNGNWSYTYDDFNRLATAKKPPANPTLAYSYSYDRFGNRWNQALTTGTGSPVSLTFGGHPRSGEIADARRNPRAVVG